MVREGAPKRILSKAQATDGWPDLVKVDETHRAIGVGYFAISSHCFAD